MNRCNRFDITSWLGTLDVDNENAMRTRGLIIFWGFAHHSISISDEKIVQGILLGSTMKALKVVELQLSSSAFSRLYFGQIL